jgi:hypothetical protein
MIDRLCVDISFCAKVAELGRRFFECRCDDSKPEGPVPPAAGKCVRNINGVLMIGVCIQPACEAFG